VSPLHYDFLFPQNRCSTPLWTQSWKAFSYLKLKFNCLLPTIHCLLEGGKRTSLIFSYLLTSPILLSWGQINSVKCLGGHGVVGNTLVYQTSSLFFPVTKYFLFPKENAGSCFLPDCLHQQYFTTPFPLPSKQLPGDAFAAPCKLLFQPPYPRSLFVPQCDSSEVPSPSPNQPALFLP